MNLKKEIGILFAKYPYMGEEGPMERGRKKAYILKRPGRFAAILAVAVGIVVMVLAWVLFLSRVKKRTADLAAYTTLTRTGEEVNAVLDLDSLLTELELPNPRTEHKTVRNGAVKALMNMELSLSFTDEPDIISVTADVNETALKRYGITLKEKTWTSPAKVLPRTPAQMEAPPDTQEMTKPVTVLADGYLLSLLDEEGKGLNLRKVCERVHFERDRLSKELFGNSYVTNKTKLWFIVYPDGSERHNCYRAVFSLAETGAPEGRSVGGCFFTVDVWDLNYKAGIGVDFSRAEVAMYDEAAEAESLDEFTGRGCTVTELIGGSVSGADRPSFDYNGFVRFVGLPMSHPLPDGSLWSPSSDPLDEEDLWRLVGNGEYTMTELLSFVRMEIYARHGYTFPNEDQGKYLQHYLTCDWYSGTEDAPERFMSPTERRNLDLVRDLEALLDS